MRSHPLPSDNLRVVRCMCAVLLALAAAPALCGELTLKLQILRLEVAEYHRPYVAVWIERENQSIASNLAVWYQTEDKKEDGTQWLKDLRQWWRRGGREQQMPIDGVTGATRPAGEHTLSWLSGSKPLSDLPPGKYNVVVEAVREVGGRELLRLALEWPATRPQHASAQGKAELGAVALDVNP
jgi:hypothetical protein